MCKLHRERSIRSQQVYVWKSGNGGTNLVDVPSFKRMIGWQPIHGFPALPGLLVVKLHRFFQGVPCAEVQTVRFASISNCRIEPSIVVAHSDARIARDGAKLVLPVFLLLLIGTGRMLTGWNHGEDSVRLWWFDITRQLLRGSSQRLGLLVVEFHRFLQRVHCSDVPVLYLASVNSYCVSPVGCQSDVGYSGNSSGPRLLRLGRNLRWTRGFSLGRRA